MCVSVCICVHVNAGLMVFFQDGSDEHQQEMFPGNGRDLQVLCPLLCTD
jgi:hypothetical protein